MKITGKITGQIYYWHYYPINMRTVFFILLFTPLYGLTDTSTCYGTTSNGRLENGVKLPSDGNNFVGCSTIASFDGMHIDYETLAAHVVALHKQERNLDPHQEHTRQAALQ